MMIIMEVSVCASFKRHAKILKLVLAKKMFQFSLIFSMITKMALLTMMNSFTKYEVKFLNKEWMPLQKLLIKWMKINRE